MSIFGQLPEYTFSRLEKMLKKPCPFCNGPGEAIMEVVKDRKEYSVQCGDCWAQTARYDNSKEPIVMWGMRKRKMP